MGETIFYSWQDDLPRRANRQLIRDALKVAIQQIGEELGIELTLDQDTQGVPGNPVVVDTILSKIRACRIFAPDLSFVATTEGGKKVPNPNVLLELGFALEALGDRKSLIVMNEYYGTPNDLPFDLGFRRWPITYNLAPDATKSDLAATRTNLQHQFTSALRTLLVEPPPASEGELDWVQVPVYKESSFLSDGDAVHRRRSGLFEDGPSEVVTWENDTQGFVRLIPARPKAFGRAEMDDLAINLLPMGKGLTEYTRGRNSRGACVYTTRHGEPRALMITQLFETGEIWGIHQPVFTARGHLPMGTVQDVFRTTLNMILDTSAKLDLSFPVRIRLGVSGIEGRRLGIESSTIDGDCVDDEVTFEASLAANGDDSDAVVAELLKRICGSAGVPPPWELSA